MTLKCNGCGRFVSDESLGNGTASHRLITPDSDYTFEEWETLCERCNKAESDLNKKEVKP